MMRAMVVPAPGMPLIAEERPMPQPAPGELLIAIGACGVCRTDLHVADGDLPQTHYPVVPGHEVVGRIAALGEGVTGWRVGARVGVPWLGSACGHCPYCAMARENLCDAPTFTGCSRDGGFASHMTADAAFCLELPDNFDDISGAPLLCAGLIGYRAYRMAGDARRLGLYGFGAAAHIIAQVAVADERAVHAFTRRDDTRSQDFARSLGAVWAGPSDAAPPDELDAAILFAPVGALVPEALRRVRKGGRVVCAGIHMSDIPRFAYADLWGEREIVSVANLTREDGHAFLARMARAPVSVHTRRYALADANVALDDLRAGRLDGAAVLVP
ncbi:MAG: zinc-dependent alcohol dehydrogenase family protein [Acuticoccus sp.]